MLYYFIILYHSFHSCFFRLQKYKFLAISENIANYLQNKNSPPPPRQGVPRRAEAFVLCLAVLGRYHSATGTVRTSLCLPLHYRVCPASRTRPTAAIRRYGRSQALPTQTNSLSSY